MNTLLLAPKDVLFFRDGRPMNGSLSGHGSAWPLPHVISHALHAALHRADFSGVHAHRRARHGVRQEKLRDRKFGSVLSAGPFPVCRHRDDRGGGRAGADTWYFPRPLDAQNAKDAEVTFQPLVRGFDRSLSSLPVPLLYPVANKQAASKQKAERWLSQRAFQAYLDDLQKEEAALDTQHDLQHDDNFAKAEHSIGIGLDAETGSQDGERFYSASYLRLKEDWHLGAFVSAEDAEFQHPTHGRDLLRALLNGRGGEIVAGGQQRICTATLEATMGRRLPMPLGRRTGFEKAPTGPDGAERWLVKWALLTPAIWPKIEEGTSKRGTTRVAHPGGWLPNWVSTVNGEVLLQAVSAEGRRERRRLNYAGQGYATDLGATAISARLVAAMVGKPLTVTGYALPHEEADRTQGGAKTTHLAVPAGAVYYFEAESAEAATALADALNWHGSTEGTVLKNRRSTLMGEKGYGLGVCSTWRLHSGVIPGQRTTPA